MSSSIQWGDTLSTHISKIDEQHKRLIDIMNSLHESFKSKTHGEAEKESLVRLIEYTDSHFSTEADLMKEHGYPEMSDHLERHREFKAKLKELCSKHLVEKIEVSQELILFLTSWLFNHIMEVDKKLAIYLREKGVQ